MAGSLSHITAEDGSFRMDLIENMGDAHEALEECHQIIAMLSERWGGERVLRDCIARLNYPQPAAIPKTMEKPQEDSTSE
jgi:hypothetical protein